VRIEPGGSCSQGGELIFGSPSFLATISDHKGAMSGNLVVAQCSRMWLPCRESPGTSPYEESTKVWAESRPNPQDLPTLPWQLGTRVDRELELAEREICNHRTKTWVAWVQFCLPAGKERMAMPFSAMRRAKCLYRV
jgi:hypothetical protein